MKPGYAVDTVGSKETRYSPPTASSTKSATNLILGRNAYVAKVARNEEEGASLLKPASIMYVTLIKTKYSENVNSKIISLKLKLYK